MSRKKKLQILEHVVITDIAAEGKAIAKVDDYVIFTEGVVPGDVVTLRITRKRNKYSEAKVHFIEKESEMRIPAFCNHFGVCGGCKWQILPYSEQISFKHKQVTNQLQRIGHIEIGETKPIVQAEQTEWYRNKLEFTFSNKRWKTAEEIAQGDIIDNNDALGFHIPGLFDKVVNINKCYLQTELSNSIRNFVRDYSLQNNYTYFDIRNHHGLMRNLIIRNSSTTNEYMVLIVFYENNTEQIQALLGAVKQQFPEITSLLYCVNQKANDTIHDQTIITYSGSDFITEHMEDLSFKIGPKSFYQTNSKQAYQLYSITRDLAQLSGNEIVYDLYTGTGTIANFVAKQAKQVIGIEYVPEAIEDAVINSQNNGITNTLFYAGDMKDVLNDEFIDKHGKPDVIITDPPRAGMHPDVVETILRCSPKRIVYVSCNPATQARDLQLLSEQYEVISSQAVDMFPHTHHVENVVLLNKK